MSDYTIKVEQCGASDPLTSEEFAPNITITTERPDCMHIECEFGYAYLDGCTDLDELEYIARQQLELYKKYIAGDVWQYTITNNITGEVFTSDSHWDGKDLCLNEGLSMIEYLDGENK